MQLEFLICEMGLNIYLTELLRKLNDINGVKYSPQWLNKYKLLLLVTTTIRERYKNQKSKILDWHLPPNTWWQPPEASFFLWEEMSKEWKINNTLLPQVKQAWLHAILSNASNLGEWKVLNLSYKERQVNLSKVNRVMI